MTYNPHYQAQEPLHSNLPYQQQPPTESLGSWILTVFLMMIPVVNLIYMLVLAFGGSASVAKRNFGRATLIWMAVGIVLSILAAIMFASFGVSVFNELSNSYTY